MPDAKMDEATGSRGVSNVGAVLSWLLIFCMINKGRCMGYFLTYGKKIKGFGIPIFIENSW